MDATKVKAGMKVRIVKIDVTTKRYKSTPQMKNMVGGVFTVHEVRRTLKAKHRVAVHMRNYTWAPEDLFPPDIKDIKGGRFDPNNLF